MSVEIHEICESTKIDKLPAITPLATQLSAAGLKARLIVATSTKDEELLRRRHDIAAALRTLNLTVEALKDGYQFDDSVAQAKIRAVEKAVGALSREEPFILQSLFKK